MSTKAENTVKTTSTVFRVLEVLLDLEGASAAEVATHVDCSKSTVYKHLNTLVNERYVVKENGEYQMGLRFLQFGEYARTRRKLYRIARPEMETLAEETGEMSNLLIEENGRGVLLNRESSDDAVSLDTNAGKEIYLHSSANGKAILSTLPREQVEGIIDCHGLPEFTENTITERGELFDHLEDIRERGWAADYGERLEGLRCVSVPIVSPEGPTLGAVSISGPKSRIDRGRLHEEIPDQLLRAQNVIEMNVAYE